MEYIICLITNCPDQETAKRVANEAQGMIDHFGVDTFLKLVDFMKAHPDMVQVGLGMIGVNSK